MTNSKKKYPSPCTPSVSHDLNNFIVEAMLLNRHGVLAEFAWRTGGAFDKVGRSLPMKVGRVSKLGVSPEQLAWLVQFHKVTDLDYAEFGLVKWKVKQYFKWCNVDKFVAYYTNLQALATKNQSSYIEATTGYKTKAASSNTRKTLSEILKELENGN